MGRNLIETIMGAVVLVVAGMFLVFAYSQAEVKQVKGYEIKASFASVGGVGTGADVRINGVKVGTVVAEILDPTSFNAILTLTVLPNIKLPADTVATIASSGLIGDSYIKLVPGKATDILAPGGTIVRAVDYKSLEEMVGDLIFLATDAPAGKKDGAAATPAAAEVPPSPALPSPEPAPAATAAPATDK